MGAAGPVGYRPGTPIPAAQYMSPYQQGVTDISKRMALQEDRSGEHPSRPTPRGAFGGSRFGLEEAKAQRPGSAAV